MFGELTLMAYCISHEGPPLCAGNRSSRVPQTQGQSRRHAQRTNGQHQNRRGRTILNYANLRMWLRLQLIREALDGGVKQFGGDHGAANEQHQRPPYRRRTQVRQYCHHGH